TYPLNFILMGLCFGGGTLLLFKSLQTIEASEMMIISAFGSLVTIFFGVTFLQEKFTTNQIIGTFLVLLAVMIINTKGKKFKLNQGALYALLSSIAFGMGIGNDGYLINKLHPHIPS